VEEKLLVNRYDKRLNGFSCKKRTKQRCGLRCRSRATVGRLADLASGFVLSLYMGVGSGLNQEYNE
jgi:hypothetical protein